MQVAQKTALGNPVFQAPDGSRWLLGSTGLFRYDTAGDVFRPAQALPVAGPYSVPVFARSGWTIFFAAAQNLYACNLPTGKIDSLPNRDAMVIHALVHGKRSSSATVLLHSCTETFTATLAPVPAHTETVLHVSTAAPLRATLRVVGTDGRLYRQEDIQLPAGTSPVAIPLSGLSVGRYHVLLQTADSVREFSLIKN